MLSVILIGAGNVASHLFNAIKKSESASIIQWYNRTIDTIKPFQNDVEITDDLSALKEADIYIMAVSDDSIAELSNASK